MTQPREHDERALPAGHDSLAFGVGRCEVGTIFVLSLAGGVTLRPRDGREILFGRNRPDVHVCVGADDLGISRVHGAIERRDGGWWIRTIGRVPVRLPGSQLLFAGEDSRPLNEGYTPAFVRGGRDREHLLEVYIADEEGLRPRPRHDNATTGPRTWRLSEHERLVLVALARRYLAHEARVVPLTWRQVADVLTAIQPGQGWTPKRVEHTAVAVRTRLSRAGVRGLTREEVGEPIGNTLNDNLIRELLLSTTIVPPDLDLLD